MRTEIANKIGRAKPPALLGNALILGVALSVILFIATIASGEYQLMLLILLLFPAVVLAAGDSKWLLPCVLCVWVFGPEARRISDWLNGSYNPRTIVSIAPMLACMTLLLPNLRRKLYLPPVLRNIVLCLLIALVFGLGVGLIQNGVAALYDFGNYFMPLLVLIYIAQRPQKIQDREMWIQSLISIAIIVSIYGWIQYTILPPWDMLWMKQVQMISIGKPEPYKLRVFSTLNAPGVASTLLMAALGPMILEKRWRQLSWFGVLLVASTLALTMVRTSWIMLLFFLMIYIFATTGAKRWKSAFSLGFALLTLFFVVPYLPGGQNVASRFETFSKLGDDRSMNVRTFYSFLFLGELVNKPLGRGMGGIGQGTTLENGGKLSKDNSIVDSGVLAILLTFGLPGGALFFYALWLTRNAINAEPHQTNAQRDYVRIARASLYTAFLGMLAGNPMTALGGVTLWYFIGLPFGKTITAEAPARSEPPSRLVPRWQPRRT